jgi:predicted lipoprotein with Yx(FWY)xxD motif
MSTMQRATTIAAMFTLAVLVVGACSATGGAGASGSGAAASAAPSGEDDSGRGGAYGGGGGYGDPDPTTAASAPPDGSAVSIGTGTGAAGTYLTGTGGMTLYIFKNDSAGKSTCDGDCATKWPPLVVAAGTPTAGSGVSGALTTFARSDGSLQVAYDGQPLYYFANDAAPGDTNGQGAGDVWFTAEP